MSLWTIGFIAGGLVVVVVALVLLGIIQQAMRIRALARVAVTVVGEIGANTRSVWALRDTNTVAATILGGAQAIDANAAAIVGVVQATHSNRTLA